MELNYSLLVQILAEIGALKQQVDILANRDFLEALAKEREQKQ